MWQLCGVLAPQHGGYWLQVQGYGRVWCSPNVGVHFKQYYLQHQLYNTLKKKTNNFGEKDHKMKEN